MSSRDRDPAFEAERPRLVAVAYRVLGSWQEAEDVVSEAWLRWDRHRAEVDEPAAWLTRVVSRIALDVLRSARVRREAYVGPWLPEPLVRPADAPPDPLDEVVAGESVRLAFVAAMEVLTPEQRVALVLHEALGLPYAEVAAVLDVTEATARQHASRARRRLRDVEPPPRPADPEVWRVLDALTAALAAGDAEALAGLLAPGVVMVSDGAGEVLAAGRPMHGEEVARFLLGLARRYESVTAVERVLVNGEPGLLLRMADPHPRAPRVAVYAVGVAEGRVAALHAVLAPAKLSRLPGAPPPAGTSHRRRTPGP